jgi:hypothetical protein
MIKLKYNLRSTEYERKLLGITLFLINIYNLMRPLAFLLYLLSSQLPASVCKFLTCFLHHHSHCRYRQAVRQAPWHRHRS